MIFSRIIRYLDFYSRAFTIHYLHSPLLAGWLLPLFHGKQPKLTAVVARRFALRRDSRMIQKKEYGAGSHFQRSDVLRVAKMARHSPVSTRESRHLAQLASAPGVHTILELGTHFGLSGASLLTLNAHARLHTIEGCPATAAIAAETFRDAGLEARTSLHIGRFEDVLPRLLLDIAPVDFLFIDGDHRGAALRENLRRCLPFLSHRGLVVIGDIYWSRDMQDAWQQLCSNLREYHAVDLFHFGLLIPMRPRDGMRHQLALTDTWHKPWRIGLFE